MSLQALSTGVSGLKSHQTRLNTVSNNIANSGTTAFKRQRAAFSEVLGQEILGVGRTAGGSAINPSKVGRGVSVASIDRDFGQGSLNDTGIKTDLALNGDGFFVASPGEGAASTERRLTRAGNFTFNQDGELVTANGLNVKGWAFEENADGEKVVNTGELKDVKLDPNAQSGAKFTSEASVGGNLSTEAENKTKTSISTVVRDEQGKAHDVVIEFTKDSDNVWGYTIQGQGSENPFNGNASGTLQFDPSGSVTSGGTATLNWKTDEVAGGEALEIDLGGITQFSGSTTAKFESQNGRAAGELADFQFTPEGVLELNFTNGEQEEVFQLAIGNVNNPNGLEQQGENFFTTTSSSGNVQLGQAGRDLRTSVVSGALESSNVDLANEFSELIEAQRSYQASSRIITTADQVLSTTVQLKQ